MSDFWGSLLNAIGIGGDNAQQQPAPPSGGQGLLGATQPQIPTWDQYNKDRSSFGGILSGMLSHGIGPGLGAALAPDSEAMQTYNAGLGQGQDVGIKGISIPRQQFMADVISGRRDGDTGKWLGEGPDPLAAQKQAQAASYAPQAPQMPGQGTPVTGASLLPPQGGAGGAGGGSAPAGPNLLAPKPASFNDMDATGIEKTLPPGLTGAVTHRDPTAFNDMDTTGMTAPPAPAAPSVVSGNGHPTFMGLPLPRGVTPSAARMSLAIDPTGKGLLEIIKQGLTPLNLKPGSRATDTYGDTISSQPVLPQGQIYQPGPNGQPGQGVTVPGANQQHAILQGIDQGAIGGREKNVKRFEYGLEYGGGPDADGGGGGGGGGGGPPPRPSGVPLSGNGGPSLTTKSMLPESATKPMQTPEGSVIPPISEMAPVDRSGANLKSAMPEWNKTRTEWYGQIRNYDVAEQRIKAIADAFAKTESGTWATDKAEFAGALKAVHIDIGDKLGSLSAVQTALKDNWAATLEQLKGISTRGPTEREIMASSKNFANPELQPEANHAIVAQTLGTIQWERKMVQDYKQYGTRAQPGAPHGWENPLDWQTSWAQHNPLQGFVEKAERATPPFMGMPGNNAAANAASAKSPAWAEGARKAPDGNYYKNDPDRPGKYLRVVPPNG